MAIKPSQWHVRHTDGTVRTVLARTLKSAARTFCASYAVERGGTFKVRERLSGTPWTVFTRTKTGIRMLGEEV